MITVRYKAQNDSWYCSSKMLLESEPDEEVLAAFDRAIQIRPNQYRVWYFRGLALLQLQQNDEAITCN
ncbi:hypothetical protein [Funiculus sociatus]|uniref:hypothetical protein n=1 Tax=Funiculus sociatus TaxID=450527 RepID=UPI003298B17F